MKLVPSYIPDAGYPANCVGATNVTKNIAKSHYDTQRPQIAKSDAQIYNPPKPDYTWPVIGLVVSAIATAIVSKMKIRP